MMGDFLEAVVAGAMIADEQKTAWVIATSSGRLALGPNGVGFPRRSRRRALII
jgi:hypothetical protein